MKNIFYAVIILSVLLSSCEKDDICSAATVTTPRLVIDFYDRINPNVPKSVTNLKVIAEGQENGIIFNAAAVDETQFVTSANTISIPLDISKDSVTYYFILNSGNANPALTNTDTITFNYSRRTQYISRACGYSVFFNLNTPATTALSPLILNSGLNDETQAWIGSFAIQNYNIDNENETHVRLLY